MAGSVIGKELQQQVECGVLVWAVITEDKQVGPFWVEDGLKIKSQTYCQF